MPIPTKLNVVMIWSPSEYCLTAENTPSGIARAQTTTSVATPRMMVMVTRSPSRSRTGRSYSNDSPNDSPKSPWMKFTAQVVYCSRNGRSSP